MPITLLISLAQAVRMSEFTVGTKVTELGQLLKLKLPVPEALIIPAKTIKLIFTHNDLETKIQKYLADTNWQDVYSIQASSKLIRAAITNAAYPKKLSQTIIHKYQESFHDGFIAVRLSPFATAQNSLHNAALNVRGDANLLESILQVLADLYLPQLLLQRKQELAVGKIIPAAIILQTMIQAKSAGVVTTADTATPHENCLAIHSVWGIADRLYEHQDYDRFYLDCRTGHIVLQQIGIKKNQHSRALDGVKVTAVPKNQQAASSLNHQELTKLSQLISVIQNQDFQLEWALAQDKFYVLSLKTEFTAIDEITTQQIIKRSATASRIKILELTNSKNFENHKTAADGFLFKLESQAIQLIVEPPLLDKQLTAIKSLKQKQVGIILPQVRNVHEALLLQQLIGQRFDKQQLLINLELATPAAILEVGEFIHLGFENFVVNLAQLNNYLMGLDDTTISHQYAPNLTLLDKLLSDFAQTTSTASQPNISWLLEPEYFPLLKSTQIAFLSQIITNPSRIEIVKKLIAQAENQFLNQ